MTNILFLYIFFEVQNESIQKQNFIFNCICDIIIFKIYFKEAQHETAAI